MEALLYTAYTHNGSAGDIIYSVSVTREYGNPGIVFGASVPNAKTPYFIYLYWMEVNSSFVLEMQYSTFTDEVFLIPNTTDMDSVTEANYVEYTEWPAGDTKLIQIRWFSNGIFEISVNGVSWDLMEVVGWPAEQHYGILCDANCSASFTSPSFVTLNRVETEIFGCLSAGDLSSVITQMLRILPDQVTDVYGCSNESSSSLNAVSFTLIGMSDRCSLALSQQFISNFNQGTNEGNGN